MMNINRFQSEKIKQLETELNEFATKEQTFKKVLGNYNVKGKWKINKRKCLLKKKQNSKDLPY